MQDPQNNPQEVLIQELKAMIFQQRQQETESRTQLEQQSQETNELLNRLTNLVGEHASLPRTRRQSTCFQDDHNHEQAEDSHSNSITITDTYSAKKVLSSMFKYPIGREMKSYQIK